MKIIVDIGATNTRIGFFDEDNKLFEKEKFATPAIYKDGKVK